MELITSHLNADFDSLAAMIAVHKLYPGGVMAFPGSQEKNVRDFLAHSPEIFNFQRLKNIDLKRVKRLILVDTRQKKRIGKIAQCLDNEGIEVHIFDHHPDSPDDIEGCHTVIQELGSTTTIITEIIQKKGITISTDDATLMYLAIHEDTGSFTFDTTTAHDLRAASWLLEQGAKSSAVSQFISQELNRQELKVLHEMISSARHYNINGLDLVLARVVVSEYMDEFALLVRKFMVMENLNAIFALANMADRVYLIARSRIPEINAGQIALAFGGGGHASAASATVRDMTMIQAEETLLERLHQFVRPVNVAADLMSAPVISVPPEITISQANEILTRYSITVLPVLEDSSRVVGLISRRITEKAIFHGIGDLPVADYMTSEFATLPPTASLAEIQEVIIERRQRFIPVVRDGRIEGVITRTDLLNLLVKDPSYIPTQQLADSHPSSQRRRNTTNLLRTTLSKKMLILLQKIGECAQETGCRAYAVGGFVRDLLRRTKNLDLDVVIEGDGILFAKRLVQLLGGTIRSHEKFKTAVITLPDGFRVDVATARLEYYEYPAAMPTVEMSSIKLDLFRRDFTINAMAIHLNPADFGILVDFFNCQNDIRDRMIRVIHNLSFIEDPTRIFRALRFEQRLGFSLGKLTEKLLKNAVKLELFERFPGGRFFHELKMILSEENPLPAIYRLNHFGLLGSLHPSLRLQQRLKNILRETHRSVAWYRLLYINEPCQEWLVFLLGLTAKLSVKQLITFAQRLEIPERHLHFLVREKSHAAKVAKILHKRATAIEFGSHASPEERPYRRRPAPEPMPLSALCRCLRGLSPEGILHLMGISSKKAAKKALSLYVTKLRHIKPALRGQDLKDLGLPPGPIFREILNRLQDANLDGRLQGRQAEIDFIRKEYAHKLTRTP